MGKLKILVVDDESRMRKLVRDFLVREGYEVLEAGDGEEALDLFYREKDIALIIMFKTIYLSGEAGNHARFVMKKDVNHIVYSIKSLQSAFVALLLDRTNLSNEPRRERSSDQPVAFLPQIAPTFCFQRFPDRILCAGHVKKCFHVPIQCAHFVHRVHGMVGRTDFP